MDNLKFKFRGITNQLFYSLVLSPSAQVEPWLLYKFGLVSSTATPSSALAYDIMTLYISYYFMKRISLCVGMGELPA